MTMSGLARVVLTATVFGGAVALHAQGAPRRPATARPTAGQIRPAAFSEFDSLIAPHSVGVLPRVVARYITMKGEFESNAQYRARVEAKLDTLYWVVALPADGYIADGCGHTITYDAEGEVFVLTRSEDSDDGAIDMSCTPRTTGSYIGTNGYGVRRRITKSVVTRYGVTGSLPYTLTTLVQAKATREEAPKLARQVAAALVFRVAPNTDDDIVDLSTERDTPTLDVPRDKQHVRWRIHTSSMYAVLYNRVTREILGTQELH